MENIEVIDTFPQFLEIWPELQVVNNSQKPDLWLGKYMSQYTELVQKQLDSYAEDRSDWRSTALDHVFPYLNDRLARMEEAHSALPHVLEDTIGRSRSRFLFPDQLVVVIYVGIGCGAGWATKYYGKPAILLGLENIAECGWQSPASLTGLISHELGHLFHQEARKDLPVKPVIPQYWTLYVEGFAQRFEHWLAGVNTWHMAQGINQEDWLDWCKSNLSYLAALYLDRTSRNETVNDFFGHWFNIEGRKQVGYFLGHELIQYLEQRKSVLEIARLDLVDQTVIQFLNVIAYPSG
jgi:hypothetical protein